jgi:hypothetical protein
VPQATDPVLAAKQEAEIETEAPDQTLESYLDEESPLALKKSLISVMAAKE